jgi:hypothetical protein
MADNLTDYEENRLLDLSLPIDGSMYLALFSATPTDSSTGTELTGDGYARQTIDFNAASSGAKTNNGEVLFPEATADWPEIQGIAIMDASTAGNMRWYRALTGGERRTVLNGDQYRVADDALSFSLS